jgi:hypothetical protein
MGMYITNELRRVVRIKQWKEGEAQREKEEVMKMLLNNKLEEKEANIERPTSNVQH